MKHKRALITLLVTILLLGFAYLQFRTWRAFQWGVFFKLSNEAEFPKLIAAVGFIYVTYLLRAYRWSVFIRRFKTVPATELLSPTIVGFAFLALLGRAGDLIRPYLISRRTGLSVSSQMAVWTVERIFDMGSVAVFIAVDLMFSSELKALPHYTEFRFGGFVLFGIVLVASIAAVVIWMRGDAVADLAQKMANIMSPKLGQAIAEKVRLFSEGLHALEDFLAFVKVSVVSLLIWLFIAVAYIEVLHAYPGMQDMDLARVCLLMSFSVVGSIVQLPAVGGGSQLAVIAAMVSILGLKQELAVSSGLMLWLCTFMSVVPIGLLLARIEHVSLRSASQQIDAAE